MKDIKEYLIYNENADIIENNGNPIWYRLMEEKKIDELILLINNGMNVSKRNNNNDSWLLHCIKNDMPNYILILGLNKENKFWFSKNNNGESAFFNKNLSVDYAEIIGKKYWTEGHSWKNLTDEQNISTVDFYKNNDMIEVAKRLEYWKKISFRR